MQEKQKTTAQVLVDCLEAEGVDVMFGIPGEETLDLMFAIRDSHIRFIPVRHEQGAAFMADVYGRLTGRAGVCLSTLHQSSLGALYLIAPGKLHPLWYSPFMPMFFFVSSMAAGCSMVIFEGMWAHKGVHHYMDETHLREADEVVFSFSKAGAFILFGYFMLKLIDMLVQANLPYLCTGYGLWWLVEMLFFVLTPALLYAKGSRDRNIKLCRFASANAVLGIVLNRFNVSMIAFNYALPADERYFPSIWEVCISIFVVTLIVTVYRFIVYHMPVLYEHPDFKDAH